MKELKFKAWDGEKIHDVVSLLGENFCKVPKKSYPYSENIVVEKVLEYIGKKDKNETEIYEGDYLVDRYPINDEDLSEGYNESLLPVMWCNEKLCWCVDVTFAKNGERLEPIHSYFGDNLEVKGSVYKKAIEKQNKK